MWDNKIIKIYDVKPEVQEKYEKLQKASKDAFDEYLESNNRLEEYLKDSLPYGARFFPRNTIADGKYVVVADRFTAEKEGL